MSHAEKNPSDVEIMMFLDGELKGTEAQAVERWLASNDEAERKSSSIKQMGEMLRTSVELDADAAEARLAGLWSGIEASMQASHANGVANAKAAQTSASKTVPSAAARAEARATEALVAKTSWFSGWLGHVATGSLVAGAVAILMFVTRPERVVEKTTVIRQNGAAAVSMPVALESQEPEVEELEVYEGSGIIMTIPGDTQEAGDGSSAVIWISNDTDVVEDPI